MTEPLYTLADARQALARQECNVDGHDIDVEQYRPGFGQAPRPLSARCARCGDSWTLTACKPPEPTYGPTGEGLDRGAALLGLTRGPGESDDDLRARLQDLRDDLEPRGTVAALRRAVGATLTGTGRIIIEDRPLPDAYVVVTTLASETPDPEATRRAIAAHVPLHVGHEHIIAPVPLGTM